jgi:hypothetical protein
MHFTSDITSSHAEQKYNLEFISPTVQESNKKYIKHFYFEETKHISFTAQRRLVRTQNMSKLQHEGPVVQGNYHKIGRIMRSS